MMIIVATMSLPAVDRPNADRWNTARSCQLVFTYRERFTHCLLQMSSAPTWHKWWHCIRSTAILDGQQTNCFAYNSATKYLSKGRAGYPLSPRIKTIAVAVVDKFNFCSNKIYSVPDLLGALQFSQKS